MQKEITLFSLENPYFQRVARVDGRKLENKMNSVENQSNFARIPSSHLQPATRRREAKGSRREAEIHHRQAPSVRAKARKNSSQRKASPVQRNTVEEYSTITMRL